MRARMIAIAAAAAVAAGAGAAVAIVQDPANEGIIYSGSEARELKLSSPAFADGAAIPREHGYKNGNVRPALEVSGAPDTARSLAIIIDDPDAQAAVGKVWVHWLAWNIPASTSQIAPGALPEGTLEGLTDFGSSGYGGPAPPDGEHTYVFKVYALDSELGLGAGSTKDQLLKAMEGRIVSEGVLHGTYAP